uniref:NADP-dependent oxidoreductase domain-containing protein n=1 Tax=Strix occidentalis caurina TaxID=311401 RepID=A0A8D0F2U1_STROC
MFICPLCGNCSEEYFSSKCARVRSLEQRKNISIYQLCFLLNVLSRFLLKVYLYLSKVEYHPFQRPQELVDYCRSRDIVFEGYCPLAKGEALTHPSIIQLAKKYGRTPAQICIRWSIQNGIVTIPKSTKAERIQENCRVRFD